MYSCSKCGLSVILYNDVFFVACECDAPINAEASAVMTGTGEVSNGGVS